jgi:hypothetical protein
VRRAVALLVAAVALLVGAAFWGVEREGGRRARTFVESPAQAQLDKATAQPDQAPVQDKRVLFDPKTDLHPGLHPPLEELIGRVTLPDGTPVDDAQVWLLSSPFDDRTRQILGMHASVESRTRTDENGRFRVEWAKGGLFSLTVGKMGLPGRIVRVPPADGEITIVLGGRTTTVEIEVVREGTGRPVVGANVAIDWLDSVAIDAGTTDAQGRYRCETGVHGPASVSVAVDDGEWIFDHWVDCRAATLNRTRIEIGRGQVVRGTVVDAVSGVPIEGASVIVGTRRNMNMVAGTDAAGAFSLESVQWDPNTRRTLTAVAKGYATWQGQIGHPKQDGGEQTIAVRLLRAAELRMRCVHPDGSPRANVLIIAESQRRIPSERVIAADNSYWVTGADGTLVLDGLAPGEWGSVTCFVEGEIVLERELEGLGASEVRDLGDLVIDAPRVLTGTVHTASGEPATGSIAVLEPHHDEDTGFAALSSAVIAPRRSARVDSTGRFLIRGVLPGSWDLLIHGGGRPRLLRTAIPVAVGKPIEELGLRLPKNVPLRGRVVDRSGGGVAGVVVAYLRAHPIAANLVETVRTDAEGRFEIPGFTRQDEGVSVHLGNVEHKVTPREGPVEFSIDR